ncbi:hypothetical protein D7X74_26355 [Corallococcus sp. CA047B]|nr:hypothetical protein D7X74_26355 [Corallococcus sp. CA047B]
MFQTDASISVEILEQQLEAWFSQSRPIDRDWIEAMRDRLRRIDSSGLAQPVRAPDLEGTWIFQPSAADVHIAPPSSTQNEESASDKAVDFLYDDRPMPAEWTPILAGLLRNLPPEPVATSALQIPLWIAEIRNKLDARDWYVLVERNLSGRTLEQVGESLRVTRQRAEQIEAHAVKTSVQLASEATTSMLKWLEPVKSAVYLAVTVTQMEAEGLPIAVGIAEKIWRHRLEVRAPSERLRLIVNKKRLDSIEETVRNNSRNIGYSSPETAATILGVSASELHGLTLLLPELVYFTSNGSLAFGNWTMAHQFESIAETLAASGFPEWHASQMGKAAAQVNPDDFGQFTPRDAIALVTRNPGVHFEHAGRRGTYRLVGYGDGFNNTLEAIKAVFAENGRALHSSDVHALLSRSVPLQNVVAALRTRSDLFRRLGDGIFEFLEGGEVNIPEKEWMLHECTVSKELDLIVLQQRARTAGLNEFRIRGLAATTREIEFLPAKGKRQALLRIREN